RSRTRRGSPAWRSVRRPRPDPPDLPPGKRMGEPAVTLDGPAHPRESSLEGDARPLGHGLPVDRANERGGMHALAELSPPGGKDREKLEALKTPQARQEALGSKKRRSPLVLGSDVNERRAPLGEVRALELRPRA